MTFVRYFKNKIAGKNSKTHFTFVKIIFSEIRDVCEIFQKNVSEKFVDKIVKHILVSSKLFFSEIRDVCERRWRNVAEPDSSQTTKLPGAFVLYTGYTRLQTHTQNM